MNRHWLRFVLHYLEMVVAMLVGMVALGPVVRGLLAAAGVAYSHTRHPELAGLEMTFSMSVGMAAWMRLRGHGWASILEMAGAMVAPPIIAVPLLLVEAIPAGTLSILMHVAMLPLMLIAMLRRRSEYTMAHRRIRPSMGTVLRIGAALLALLILPVAVGAAGTATTLKSLYEPAQQPAASMDAAAAGRIAHDPRKPTAALVVGNYGANVADLLAPYEVLATTGAFNVYTVAPERRPVPLTGGLDLVPDLSFAELDERLGGAAPRVIVVPAMPDAGKPTGAPVTAWLRQQKQRQGDDDVLLSVCNGAAVVAAAGLLDGHDATSAWIRLPGLERRHPAVTWHRGIRYVDDGDVITTGAVLSGIDGTLRVVERLIGPAAATTAAKTVGWRHYSPDAPAAIAKSGLEPGDAVAAFNAAYRWRPTNIGVLLTDGVGEMELASAFSPYTEQSFAARTLSIAISNGPVRSRHGLAFVPRTDLRHASGRIDRLVVPGADAARRRDLVLAARADSMNLTPEYLHERPGFPFDAALRDLARTVDVPTARWAAKVLEYPTADLELTGPGWPWPLTFRPVVLALAGLAIAVCVDRLLRARSACGCRKLIDVMRPGHIRG